MDPGLRVLVAEDDPVLLHMVADAAEHMGAIVTRAHTGGELIEALGDHGPFDLVITDISMPWMTGLQAMQATRYAGLTTPVLVITALRDTNIPDQVKALGHRAALLHKPFGLEQLERAIDDLMAQPRGPGKGARAER